MTAGGGTWLITGIVPMCRCGHSWDDHSDHGERCLKCDCQSARYGGQVGDEG